MDARVDGGVMKRLDLAINDHTGMLDIPELTEDVYKRQMKMTALSWNVLAKILKNTNRRTATAAISRNMRKVALY